MSQLAIYLDEKTAALVDEAAKRLGLSRSAWARKAIQDVLRNQLPDSFFEVLGAWEDGRSAEAILEDIRDFPETRDRAILD